MKTKAKWISLIAAALCAMLSCVCLLSACGGEEETERDYAAYTYSDWAALEDSVWDAKTITYQIDTDNFKNAVAGSTFRLLINLYEDGTLLIWQAGIYDTSEGMSDPAWEDADRHIAWKFFGFWEEENSVIKLYYFCTKADAELTVNKTSDWAENSYCYYLEITDKVLRSDGDKNNDANMKYLSANIRGEEFPIGAEESQVLSGSAIKYNTLASFVDSYINEIYDTI